MCVTLLCRLFVTVCLSILSVCCLFFANCYHLYKCRYVLPSCSLLTECSSDSCLHESLFVSVSFLSFYQLVCFFTSPPRQYPETHLHVLLHMPLTHSFLLPFTLSHFHFPFAFHTLIPHLCLILSSPPCPYHSFLLPLPLSYCSLFLSSFTKSFLIFASYSHPPLPLSLSSFLSPSHTVSFLGPLPHCFLLPLPLSQSFLLPVKAPHRHTRQGINRIQGERKEMFVYLIFPRTETKHKYTMFSFGIPQVDRPRNARISD